MPTYSFRCAACGAFDVQCAIADRTLTQRCPICGGEGSRLFTAPALRRLPVAVRGALAASERSADAPDVVTSVPRSSRATAVTRDPRHLTLPRP